MSRMMERQTSIPALWCQRLALFLLLYFLIVIIGQRWQFIETPAVLWLLAVGLILILVAIGLGGIGLAQLWLYGHKGGMRSVRGILVLLVMLAPYGWFATLAFTLPPINDISTDKISPPVFELAVKHRTSQMNEINRLGDAELDLQSAAYPLVLTRRYSTTSERVVSAARKLIKNRNWQVLGAAVPVVDDLVDLAGSGDRSSQENRQTTPRQRPVNPNYDAESVLERLLSGGAVAAGQGQDFGIIYIETVARSLIFGFASDVIVRIVEEGEVTVVDMRSASRWGVHDFGANARQIVDFLDDLDRELAGVASGG